MKIFSKISKFICGNRNAFEIQERDRVVRMAERILQMPESTMYALEDLANIAGKEISIDQVIEKALQRYEQSLYHEFQGNFTAVVDGSGKIIEYFPLLIGAGKEEKAKRYFEKNCP